MPVSLSKILAASRWGLLAILAVAAFAVAVLPRATGYKWLWVHGPSVNVTLGLLKPDVPEELESGGYVLMVWKGIDPNGVSKLQEGTIMVKKVGCLPGQYLKVTLVQADCDGVKVGHIRHETMDGKPISPALYDGIIPTGKVFLLGEHYYSYDSRYFGLVPVEWLRGSLQFTI
jgi:Type IV secretory pathway, protease TraF